MWKGQVRGKRWSGSPPPLLALKLEEGTMNQGRWFQLRGWKVQRDGSSLGHPERNKIVWRFEPSKMHFRLLNHRNVKWSTRVTVSHHICVNSSYNSDRKVAQVDRDWITQNKTLNLDEAGMAPRSNFVIGENKKATFTFYTPEYSELNLGPCCSFVRTSLFYQNDLCLEEWHIKLFRINELKWLLLKAGLEWGKCGGNKVWRKQSQISSIGIPGMGKPPGARLLLTWDRQLPHTDYRQSHLSPPSTSLWTHSSGAMNSPGCHTECRQEFPMPRGKTDCFAVLGVFMFSLLLPTAFYVPVSLPL